MAEVERLLSDYIAEHRNGGDADPRPYLERVEGTDRAELAALIDAYLERSPGREWDPEAFEGSEAAIIANRLARSVCGESGMWPVVLPRLRERARLMREAIVARLAAALGVAGREEKVAEYYHRMEHGTLPAEGVDPRVIERLAEILQTSADVLREAGRQTGPGAGAGGPAPVFTRTKAGGETGRPEAEPGAGAGRAEECAEGEWDEVDRLFRGASPPR